MVLNLPYDKTNLHVILKNIPIVRLKLKCDRGCGLSALRMGIADADSEWLAVQRVYICLECSGILIEWYDIINESRIYDNSIKIG